MKKLWLVPNLMVACGIVSTLGGTLLGLGPIALICGVLLIWSWIVKVVVLSVWRATIPATPHPEQASLSSAALGEPK